MTAFHFLTQLLAREGQCLAFSWPSEMLKRYRTAIKAGRETTDEQLAELLTEAGNVILRRGVIDAVLPPEGTIDGWTYKD
jgi:hypothetical protein